MKFTNKLREFTGTLKREITIYRLVLKDKRTPLIPKLLLFLSIGYLLMPFDLIPDFIPVIGQIDDVIIAPLLFYTALKLIPNYIIEEYRNLDYGINQV
jgi:uncharacterized membrane protein YkvA (DUF1232 family)